MTGLRACRALAAGLLLGALMGAGGCQSEQDRLYQTQLLAFGTLVEVVLWDVDEALASRALAAVSEDLSYMHEAWHAWEPGALGRINELLPTGARFTANPSVLPLIERAKVLSRESGGLFNPAIGRLVALWGFHTDAAPQGPPPADSAIRALLAERPRMEDVVVEGIRVHSTNPAVQLDFGGFAKGYAVDRVVEHLRELGVRNAIVNAGGDLRAIGRRGDRPWRIGIRHPRGEGILASVEVSGDETVFTSGDYERFFEFQGRRYHHILDPRSGYPAANTASVTVMHREGAVADAAATALFVAGPRHWQSAARAMGLRHVMLIDQEGVIHMTPAMRERVRFEIQPLPRIVVSAPL